MQRSIRFSNFRNLGLEKDDYLVLNGDYQKGKAGNLVILIGSNNSGKSNVLDGIRKVCNDDALQTRDITNLYLDEDHKKPCLSLVYRDDKYTFELKKTIGSNQRKWQITSGNKPDPKRPAPNHIKESIKTIYSYCSNLGIRFRNLNNLINEINNNSINDEDLLTEAVDVLNVLYNQYNFPTNYSHQWRTFKNNKDQLIEYYEAINSDCNSFVRDYLLKETKLDAYVPRVVVYKENYIGNSDLNINNYNNIEGSSFFVSLFKAIKVDTKTIQNTYDQFNQTGNITFLKKLEKDLQKKIDKLNNRFNSLYFAGNDQYKFSLIVESNRLWFGMARGKEEDAINLEYQSTGFRWFFNLFFNFLSLNELRPGDIVIMDEPATNLHVGGQKELRAFIKQFAIENDVLFVLATHSPFLLDPDHYDELRVVSMDNNRSKIDNHFTAVNLNDPDSLLPIKDALTIKQHVLYDLDTEVYFVEGITDYNYLTMFKKLLGVNNISFLPFNGVGNNSEQTKKILQRLLSIKFHKRSLLVDADKAGKDMYNQAKDSAFDSVHSLSEIKLSDTKNAMMVEDLFSPEDKKKFPAITDKKSDGTSVMKDHCKLSDFSESTVNHFKELFKLLLD